MESLSPKTNRRDMCVCMCMANVIKKNKESGTDRKDKVKSPEPQRGGSSVWPPPSGAEAAGAEESVQEETEWLRVLGEPKQARWVL